MSKFNSGLFHGTNGSQQRSLEPFGQREPGVSRRITDASHGASAREVLLSEAKTDLARNLIKELYRSGAEVGDGGTADAIRQELASGKPVRGRSHIQKGRERLRQIDKIIARNPTHPDRDLLERLAKDLREALGGEQ